MKNKIDCHTHSSEISRCAVVDCKTLINNKISYGYDGIVLTNHCHPSDFDNQSVSDWAEKFIATYRNAVDYAKSKDFIFIFGIEVTLESPVHAHYLLYGITDEFLRNCGCLCSLNQEELFRLTQKNHIFMVEAHPFREWFELGDTKFLNGVELNCKPCDFEIKEKVTRLAESTGLTLTCGTDYHGKTEETIHGGMMLPKSIKTAVELSDYLFSNNKTELSY